MLTQTNPINAAAAKRILGFPQSRKIEFVTVSQTEIVIRYKDQTYTLTPDQFADDFINVRKEGAKECLATPHKRDTWGEQFRVVGAKGDTYQVEASDRAIACTCEDWATHEQICKHGYAVLNLLGLTTLDEYRTARSMVAFRTTRAEVLRNAKIVGGVLTMGGLSIE
jgi:hypothetical protein